MWVEMLDDDGRLGNRRSCIDQNRKRFSGQRAPNSASVSGSVRVSIRKVNGVSFS